MPCAVVKTTLRLELLAPSTTHNMDTFRPSNPRKADLCRQRLLVRALPLIQVDGLDTVLPSKYWQGITPKYRRWLRIGLLLLAFISWVMTGIQFMLCIWRVLALDMMMKPLETTPGDLIRSAVGAVCALMFYGTFVLFSQRDLLWALVTSFDFIFPSIQILLLDLCFCDLVGWQLDQTIMGFTYIVWSHWALILDGLTPNIKRDVLGFSKRYAIPVSASVVLSGLGLLGLTLYVSPGTLHNRVLWEHTVASKRIISIRTQTILLGRIFTIVFWCSRQTVLLFLRKEDELQSLFFNSLYWVCLGFVFRDTRVLMCVYGWLHLQVITVVDANLRFMRETVLSAWIGTPGILILATLAAFDKFPDQKESPIVLFVQALGDATDALSLTATTLFIFLFKIVVLKRRSVIPASLQSSSSISSMGREAARPHREIERWFDILLGVVAFLGTVVFCGGCMALCQRDLLRILLRSFDFVFSWVQITLFGICLCDMVEWYADRTLVIGSWVVWFHWVLSLDALTPVVRYKVLGFSRRLITPILMLVVVACVGGFYRVAFLSISGFENRVIWEYNISTTQTIEVQTEELFLGRVSFILLRCSRQLYVLFMRGVNELFVLHGRVDLATTRTSVMASFSRIIKVFPVLKSTKRSKAKRGGWLGNSGGL
ncbi:hypothetical protein Poli38472_010393 [Pythium oligandrum]|uniref:Uncharacterized protein n=1 Tax=Pythium oligandrum TaxID=41045 RepID=A0A8K1C300_PYTOL|nr:hypothetical protein Poli38472_010393 [Pythium oligandrum]|eukprot:TMW55511.1 hypothetical protein Poli38472_010393 [Pythium oligandrum]